MPLVCWCVKKHLPGISPGISLTSFIQSHALAPASQAVGQRYRRWVSNNPTLVQCLVLAVLSYNWTGHCKASVNVVGLRWHFIGLIRCPHILRIVPLPKIYMMLSANVRPASQPTLTRYCFPNFINRLSKKKTIKESRVVGRGSWVEEVEGVFEISVNMHISQPLQVNTPGGNDARW